METLHTYAVPSDRHSQFRVASSGGPKRSFHVMQCRLLFARNGVERGKPAQFRTNGAQDAALSRRHSALSGRQDELDGREARLEAQERVLADRRAAVEARLCMPSESWSCVWVKRLQTKLHG